MAPKFPNQIFSISSKMDVTPHILELATLHCDVLLQRTTYWVSTPTFSSKVGQVMAGSNEYTQEEIKKLFMVEKAVEWGIVKDPLQEARYPAKDILWSDEELRDVDPSAPPPELMALRLPADVTPETVAIATRYCDALLKRKPERKKGLTLFNKIELLRSEKAYDPDFAKLEKVKNAILMNRVRDPLEDGLIPEALRQPLPPLVKL